MQHENVSERAFQRAMCELLARAVPADHIIRKIEEETLAHQVREITGLERGELLEFLKVLAEDRVDRTGPSASCLLLRQHVPLETRKRLVRLLWDISACDGVMHELEEHYILFVADLLEVPRRDVLAAQAAAGKSRATGGAPPPPSVAELTAPPRLRNPRSRSYS